MFDHLQIGDRRERLLVGSADAALRLAGPLLKLARRRPAAVPRRILLMRIERIGDLLMSLDAIDDVRHAAPGASIDLVVGSWNADLARRIRGIDRVETLDAAWLAREGRGEPLAAMMRRGAQWRSRRYDLGINFEPDVRSHLVLAAAAPARTAGFASGGGGPLLDVALPYDPSAHTAANGQRLVHAVLRVPPREEPARLDLTSEDRRHAARLLQRGAAPLVGVHVSGGRAIKQWDPQRFAELALRLARASRATIVLTGTSADGALLAPVRAALSGIPHLDLAGQVDLPTLAGVLEGLDVFVTGDTGPMHLASAVGTPVVAIFGPSDPRRYAPRGRAHAVIRVDLPCSPCNRIRLPPERCTGHVPDCLTGIDVEMVLRAVERVLEQRRPAAAGLARG